MIILFGYRLIEGKCNDVKPNLQVFKYKHIHQTSALSLMDLKLLTKNDQ